MSKFKVIENSLIPVMEGNDGVKLVDARKLYDFLEVKKDFSDWIKYRISQYAFIEDEDFTTILGKSTGGRPSIEYILNLDAAKELCMVESNEKGKEARKYFIGIEKKYKQLVKPVCIEDVLIQSLQEMKNMKLEVQQAKEQTAAVKQEVEGIKEVIILNPKAEWRKETNDIVSKICKRLSDYQKPKEELYKALEQRAGCKLKIRLENLRGRALKEGMTKTKVNNLNYLDVIENDIRLKEIYIAIVKEMAIKNGVSVKEAV